MRLYPITIDISKLTAEMITWAEMQGAEITDDSLHKRTIVRFANSKASAGVSGNGMRLHFNYSEKNTALLFLLMFDNYVINHNMEELKNIKDIYATA